MKKSIIISHSFLFIVLGIALFSCKKNESIKSTTPLSQELNDYKFLNQRLRKFAADFAPALNNNKARNFIRNKARLKFDEEYEVLIKDLFNDNQIKLLASISISEKLHTDLFKRSGKPIYPQIYIPHFQYLEDNFLLNRTDSVEEDPVYVFYTGDPEVDSSQNGEIWPSYRLVNGEYEFYTMVDEDYANEHEVWIFSVNESPEVSRAALPCDVDPCAPGCPLSETSACGTGGGGGETTNPDDDPTDNPQARNDFPDLNHNKINFRIQNMKITLFNEEWPAGASEIAIRAKLVCHNGRNLGIPGSFPDQYTSDQVSNYLGKLIKKVKRKDIRHEVWQMNINYPLQTNWQNEVPSQDPVHFMYTIFERDIFPASLNTDLGQQFGLRYALNSPISGEAAPGGGFKLFFRSSNHNSNNYPYAKSHFTNTLILATSDKYAGSGLVESSSGGIFFNTVTY